MTGKVAPSLQPSPADEGEDKGTLGPTLSLKREGERHHFFL